MYVTKGYVHNCFLQPRDWKQPMFVSRDGGPIVATLDGYAIIPVEEYNRLAVAAGEEPISAKVMSSSVIPRLIS